MPKKKHVEHKMTREAVKRLFRGNVVEHADRAVYEHNVKERPSAKPLKGSQLPRKGHNM